MATRDFDFATHFNFTHHHIFDGVDISEGAFTDKGKVKLMNSDFLNGLDYKAALDRVISALESKKSGKGAVNFRLRDAIFSRQRYWGEPIPIYFKGGIPIPLKEEHLPLEAPQERKVPPTERIPLGNAKIWAWDEINEEVVSIDRIDHQFVFPLELNTMPGWAEGSWYFNRYYAMDAQNQKEWVAPKAMKYWREADFIWVEMNMRQDTFYIRGFGKVLFDLGYVRTEEYAKSWLIKE